MKIKFVIALVLGWGLFAGRAEAQEVAVKTNMLYWATTTPNLALEFGLGKKTTLDIVGLYNPFEFHNNLKLKHWIVQPEIRLWHCEKFNRGFWGIHAMYGDFNAGNINLPLGVFRNLDDNRYQGYMVGGGVSYGWQWYLGPHWNLEATFGFGYAYLNYDRYEKEDCGLKTAHGKHHYFGPTKLGVTFVYLFKSKK